MSIPSEPTSVAGDGAETTALPSGVQTGDVDPASSVTDTAPHIVSGDGRRPLFKTLLAIPAGIAVAAVALGAFVFGEHEPEHVNALPTQSTSTAPSRAPAAAAPSHEVLAVVIVPAAKRAPVAPSTAPKPRPTVTIEASPAAATEKPAPAPSSSFDPSRDQWLLGNLRSLGYTIINPSLVISSAYQACRLFQQGESPEQVNQQMSALTGMNIDDTLQLTSSAMLAYYPNCA
jgi:hypothetical protein